MSDGFLLLHGKGSGPNDPTCSTAVLYQRMLKDGALVDYVANSWALGKLYQYPFEQCISDVQQGIDRLVTRGATRIHIVGHSLGANIALYYATQYTNFKSIVALAPAHNTHLAKFNQWSLWSRNKAQSLINQGDDTQADFVDVAMMEVYITSGRPSSYLSFQNPNGNTVMTRNVRRFLRPINLFMATGSNDVTQVEVASMIYNPAKKTDASRLLSTNDGHTDISVNTYPIWLHWCVGLD